MVVNYDIYRILIHLPSCIYIHINLSYNNHSSLIKVVNFIGGLRLLAAKPKRKVNANSNTNTYVYGYVPVCRHSFYICNIDTHMFLQALKVIKCVCAAFFRNLTLLYKFPTTLDKLVF